jgi:hypothetical protein
MAMLWISFQCPIIRCSTFSDSAVVLSAIAMVVLSFRGVDYQTPDAMPENLDSDQK